MDPLAVHLAMQEALAWMRAGKGPAVIEADVYRFFHQNGPFPGSAFGYRTKAEEQEWRARDPLALLAGRMQARGLLTADDAEALRQRVKDAMAQACAQLRSEEHTSELQSLMRISYAVFCLKKKKKPQNTEQ